MLRTRPQTVAGIAVLAAMWLGVAPVQASSGWTEVPLPGGRQALLPALGLPAELPRAMTVAEIIRVAHASRDVRTPSLAALNAWAAAPPPAGDEMVPIPLAPENWHVLLGRAVPLRELLPAILSNVRTALTCYGLLSLDRETLAFVAQNPAVLRGIYESRAGVLAGYGGALHVRDGRLVLPGGDEAQVVWESLLDSPLADATRALPALLGRDDGRLVYFADALENLDTAHLRLALGLGLAPEDALEQARSVYRAFERVEEGWDITEFPFVRMPVDPAFVIGLVELTPEGRLAHTRRFWEQAFADGDPPEHPERRWANIDDGDPAEPGWLLEQLTAPPLPVRQARALMYFFEGRIAARLPQSTAAERLLLARAYRRFPALLLVLERMGIAQTATLRAAVRRAISIDRVTDPRAREVALTLFQAPLALLDRAYQVRTIDSAKADALVSSLCALDLAAHTGGRQLATWLREVMMPALSPVPPAEDMLENALLEGLAGLHTPSLQRSAPVTWEAYGYRVDASAPELARLTEVRQLQGGNTLDVALAFAAAGASLARAGSVDDVHVAAAAMKTLGSRIEPIEASERPGSEPPPDLQALVAGAATDLGRVRTKADLKKAANVAERLDAGAAAALSDVMTSIVYALWLGDPQGQAFLAGSIARRHDFGARAIASPERSITPWTMPYEESGGGEPWHVRGALLGMDIGLGRLALRRTRVDLPSVRPTLNDSDRKTIITSIVLTPAAALEDASAMRVVGWLREGRAIAARAGQDPAFAARLDGLMLGGRRGEALRWAASQAPSEVPDLLLVTELTLLGRQTDEPVPLEWGSAETSRTGCLCLDFPDPPMLQRYLGRAGAGLLTGRMADLKLRVLELLAELGLPPVLAPAVLASAAQDYLEEARPAHIDDWWSLAHEANTISRTRVEDYVSALTAGGPLVPAANPGTDGHE